MSRTKKRFAVGVASLGCAKNLVDTEEMLGRLVAEDYVITREPESADILIINTCGFIDAAKEESIDAILELLQYREQGECVGVIVTGCLSQRYRNELADEIPEVDAWLGVNEYDRIVPLVTELLRSDENAKRRPAPPRTERNHGAINRSDAGVPARYRTGPAHYRYLKIADGCDHTCSFCAIPMIRGPYRSLRPNCIEASARALVEEGAKELVLVAQDTSSYGRDLDEAIRLPDLIRRLCGIDGLEWIRSLYLQPQHVSENLISAFAEEPKVVPYFDLPVQHADADVLRGMRRGYDAEQIRRLTEKIRAVMPDVVIRSAVIVGFPGETDNAFDNLLEFVREIKFDRLGAFVFSPEEGTRAYSLPGSISRREAEDRRSEVMALQEEISLARHQTWVNRTQKVIVDRRPEDGSAIARSYAFAPEADGVIHIVDGAPHVGEFVDVRIREAMPHDLVARVEPA